MVNARLAGIGDLTGSIETGKAADIIVVKDNPLENLEALRKVDMVMTAGKLIKEPSFKRNEIVDRELDKFL